MNLTAYVPLHSFSCASEDFLVAPGVQLRRFAQRPAINLKGLSSHELAELDGVGHWLVIDSDPAGRRSAAERMNHWAFALWLVRTTKLELHFRFEESEDGKYHHFARLLSRPNWNEEDVDHGPFTADELIEARRTFAVFESIATQSRLGMALSLTAESIWQHRWHAAIVLHSAAAETLLTFERGSGLSSRLADAYAALVAPGNGDRRPAVATFRAAYDARSGVVHGRTELDDEGARLRALALWSGIVRDIWRVVVAEPTVLAALQGDDVIRKTFIALR